MAFIDGPFIAPRSGRPARQLVVFLHGYGANGSDLLDMVQEWGPDLPDAAFVAPNAPDVCEAWSAGHQWFSLRGAEGAVTKDAFDRKELIMKPSKKLDGFLDTQLHKWNVDESRLAVAGFSQGAMMASYVMPRRLKACAGIICYSGLLVDAGGLKGERVVKMPVLAIHGDADTVVPPSSLDDMQVGFEAAGFQVETILRPGLGHGIDRLGIIRGLSFLQEAFGKLPKK